MVNSKDPRLDGHRDLVFSVVMALYAGEENDYVFEQLDELVEKYPLEVQFYIPQLCTYLFHFS